MLDDLDDGARVGVWTTLGLITLLLFGLLGGLALRKLHHTPAPAAAETTSVGETLLEGPLTGDLTGTLYFASGDATLPPEAAAELASVKRAADAAPARKLVLSGFHDTSGDPVKNAELAKQRAKAVREALQAGGIDPARIALRKPETTTGTGPAEHARRVEIRLVD